MEQAPPQIARPRIITIYTVLNGWVAQVGCQHVVFVHMKDMIAALDAYLKNPAAMEKDWLERSENAKFFNTRLGLDNPGSTVGDVLRRRE